MNLTIDFGNSSIKAALFEKDRMKHFFHEISQIELLKLVNQHLDYAIILSSVTYDSTHFINLIEKKERLTILSHQTKIPVNNLYETPETLGMDRLAAVTGANTLFTDKNCLVIDAGTAITYDFIDQSGNYLGGSISPGILLRYKSLHTFTARLPLLESKEFSDDIGRNTKEAITTGVLKGIVGEAEYMIRSFKDKYDNLQVVVCGGDAWFFESKIKERIFAIPELVLVGLNRILNHNALTA